MFAAKYVVCFGLLATVQASGEPECPCISNRSDLDQLRLDLVAAGHTENYGLEGCAAYDVNDSASGCGSNESPHCVNPWCFVDMNLCPLNVEKCHMAGGMPGSEVSPYCRTRPHLPRTLGNTSVFYSYETCGSVNMYDSTRHSINVGGHVVRVVVNPVAPWVLRRTGSGLLQTKEHGGYGGPSFDFFIRTLVLFEPEPILKILPGWATPQSKQKFQSDYTACVHDVALGTFDLCIADLWLTPERHLLASFVPPLRQDYFFLVVPRKTERVTWWARLSSPFQPFAPSAWFGILAFLCLMSLLLWLVQICENDQNEGCVAKCSWSVEELVRTHFYVFHDFLLGQSSIPVQNGATRKFLSAAVSFFILVVLASYTASLASILVIQRQSVGTISNMDEAIEREIPICAPSALLRTFSTVFPRASFVESPEERNGPRLVYSGACDAVIMSQVAIDTMHAGQLQERDCNAVASGSITEEVGRCERDSFGNPRNDCNLIRVGDVLWSVPISFPVSARMAHSMSWAFTYAMTNGLMEEMKKLNADVFPVPHCSVEDERSDEDGLNLDDLSGTILIALSIAAFGFLCFLGSVAWSVLCRKRAAGEAESTSASERERDKEPSRAKPKRPREKEGSRLASLEEQPFDDQIVPTELGASDRVVGLCDCFQAELRR
ncbi:GLR3.2 [Symbiodinium natans]|uniref:GLR3.2 protein n=1 Tax=Symbiodinium natans TaxID=878477 RepID=A0A812IKD5_9DINO|nr:GLR3.2 [Symbiodinium natans]